MARDTLDYFYNYITIKARFDSVAKCGHKVEKGDVIGYNPLNKATRCESCWERWRDENTEAAAYEAALPWT
jgi:hypothetical protein